MFTHLGDGTLSGGSLRAILGTLIVALVYPLYRLCCLDRRQTLAAAFFLAISPNMVYFSRFLRNDIFILFLTFVLLLALILYLERGQARYAMITSGGGGGRSFVQENMPLVPRSSG